MLIKISCQKDILFNFKRLPITFKFYFIHLGVVLGIVIIVLFNCLPIHFKFVCTVFNLFPYLCDELSSFVLWRISWATSKSAKYGSKYFI